MPLKLWMITIVWLNLSWWAQADIVSYLDKTKGQAKWEVLEEKTLSGGMVSMVLELTSQHWQGIDWKHRLRLLVPPNSKAREAILIIGGSRPKIDKTSNHEVPDKLEKRGIEVAEGVAAPVALLYDVPNQPLYGGLTEDRLVAETFRRYKDTGDQDWPILLPMVRSAVAAMDCLQVLLKEKNQLIVDHFMLTGASKRGWTTWLTATVDDRVFGIAPMVYDNLNLRAQMQHQLDSWGKYSPSISAYTNLNLPQLLLNEEGGVTALADLVDPWTRRSKLTMPKLLINGTNDPFWVVDAYSIYKEDLPGQVYLHFAPNAEHGLNKGREGVVSTTVSFFKSLQGRVQMPMQSFDWSESKDGLSMKFKTDVEPFDVSLYVAENIVRDFRKASWVMIPQDVREKSANVSIQPKPALWRACFLQAVYLVDGEELILSSEVKVLSPAL